VSITGWTDIGNMERVRSGHRKSSNVPERRKNNFLLACLKLVKMRGPFSIEHGQGL